ncbi:MAG: hypothetical protein K6B28_08090 [Lachnospiraceae bacterium]|nr:hypothetical protein [Lachnospiraceae bacterium]
MTEETRNYIKNVLTQKSEPEDDSAFLSVWRDILSGDEDHAELLNEYLINSRPVDFKEPSEVSICLYDSFAGTIPVIEIGNDDDFELFITNVANKGIWNDNVKKQGASFLAGKTNRFIVLSKKPYSNVEASWMGIPKKEWRERSMILRREHEYTHYYTRRFYGSARNNLHDELMADFFGIYAAFGYYRAEWFDHFMGLDGREGGRISLYTQELSDGSRDEVMRIGRICSAFLEKWSEGEEFKNMTVPERTDYLCSIGIDGMICGNQP